MAPVTEIVATTDSVDYPTVTAYLFPNPVRFGDAEGRGPWRVVRYKIEGQDSGIRAALFIDWLRGRTQIVTFPGWAPQIYRRPHRFPGNMSLVCLEAEGELIGAVGPGEQMLESTYAQVLATYGTPDYPLDLQDDPQGIASLPGGPYAFMTIRRTSGYDEVPVRQESEDEDQTFPDGRIRIPTITYHCKFFNLPFLGEEIVTALTGRVNQYEIFGKQPETLRFDGADDELTRSPAGERNYEVDFQLTWRYIGWNHEYPEQGGAPARVTMPDGTPKYQLADFSPLRTTALGGP